MAGEYYRVVKPITFLGLPRAELDASLPPSDLDTIRPFLDRNTVHEPLHVSLRDQGIISNVQTPLILRLDTIASEISGGLNEIPAATCVVAVGRDLGLMAAGASDFDSVAVVHILEKYLSQHVKAKIYFQAVTTAMEGFGDLSDNEPWPDETVVLFDGYTSSPTRRGSPDSSTFVLKLSHFSAALGFSSSISASVAAGSASPAAFRPLVFGSLLSGIGSPMTPYGAVTAALAGGTALLTDFWGYQVPAGTATPPSLGLKGFLDKLANDDQFNWAGFRIADLGGTACSRRPVEQLKNNRALAALARIEPIWPDWAAIGGAVGGPGGIANAAASARINWNNVKTAIDSARDDRAAQFSTKAIDRADIISRAGNSYSSAGYRYGVPINFYLTDSTLAPLVQSRGFAMDITAATFANLAPLSFWELLVGQYSPNYQIAFAPMADRAVMMPVQPVLDDVWQFVASSEIFSWEDDIQTPVPIRGVILVSDRASSAGTFAQGFNNLEAGYDSCQDGVFIIKQMPSWLMSAYRAPGVASKGAGGTRVTTANPSAMAAITGTAITSVDPPDTKKSTANRLAKAYYQQERLRYRNIYVTTRLRHDIGPGSIVAFELPADKNVRAVVGDNRDSIMVGMVLRVTMSLNAEGDTASTSYQIGFARTQAELKRGQPLFGDSHPFWSTATYGIPWADSVWTRQQLGTAASLFRIGG